MEKAYDLKELASRLSVDGREMTEEAAIIIIKKSFEWLSESAVLSENKIDDMLSVMYPLAKEKALQYADHIDGKEG